MRLPKQILFLILVFAFSAFADSREASPLSSPMSSPLGAPVEPRETPLRLSDLPMRLNAEFGVSSFQYSGQGGGRPEPTGGVSIEFGGPVYRVELGGLYLKTSSTAVWSTQPESTRINTSWLALPIFVKFRLFSSTGQDWSLKAGFLQGFVLASNKGEATNRTDVLGAFGISGRLAFLLNVDLLVEASYNRGLLPALRSVTADSFNEGTLVLLGLSFRR